MAWHGLWGFNFIIISFFFFLIDSIIIMSANICSFWIICKKYTILKIIFLFLHSKHMNDNLVLFWFNNKISSFDHKIIIIIVYITLIKFFSHSSQLFEAVNGNLNSFRIAVSENISCNGLFDVLYPPQMIPETNKGSMLLLFNRKQVDLERLVL